MSASKPTTIIGIDPGYDRVGWAVAEASSIHSVKILDYNCIQTNRDQTLAQRYLEIQRQLTAIITKHQPTVMAIEKLFFAKSTTTAMQVAEARGVILMVAASHNLTINEFSPPQIKLAVTGDGRASKTAMTKLIKTQLNLPDANIMDDTIDALGLVLTQLATQIPYF